MICLPAGAGLVRPAGSTPPGGWVQSGIWTPSGINEPGYGGVTLRVSIPTAGLLAGSKIRLTILAGSATQTVIGKAYTQIKASSGGPFDFASTPVQILFGGNAGVTITGGSEVVTDDISLPIDGLTALIVSMYFSPGTSAVRRTDGSGLWNSGYLPGDDAASLTGTGAYNGLSVAAYQIRRVEIFQP